MNKQNKPSKPGRTPQDKINRHVNFALHNSESGRMRPQGLYKIGQNLLPDALPIFSQWLKNLRHLNTLPLTSSFWSVGICRTCLSVNFFVNPSTYNNLVNFRHTLLESWPKFSGDTAFPIKGGSKACKNPTTEYKQLRKELSLHCIAELENLLIPQYSAGNLPLEHRIEILKILKRLYRLPTTNDSWETGLCYHITVVEGLSVKASMNYTAEHFKTWKYFSGEDNNPIPREAEINKTKSRKQLRKNLCGHVIKSIEAELKYVL